jgi:hypothetical protein
MRAQTFDTATDPDDAVLREMLLHRAYELPFMQEILQDAPVICSQCGESGETVEDIQHQRGCIYEEPTCMAIPY